MSRFLNELFVLICLLTLVTSLSFNHSQHIRGYRVAYIPHPDKVQKGGEDAYFASKQLLVVADGVGGWNKQGIDPSLYSRFLCSASEVYFNEDSFHYSRNPQQLIVKAQRNNRHPGSSTMSVATLEGSTLRSCHIGDCRLMVIRRYKEYRLIFQTVDQLHGFNFPYQLAQSEYGGDDPHEAICSSLEVREGDLIVLSSDGMADNIFSFETVVLAERNYQNSTMPLLAKKLAKLAVERAKKKDGLSPFGVKAKEWGIRFQGGKMDDTTVIVAEIVDWQNHKSQEKSL